MDPARFETFLAERLDSLLPSGRVPSNLASSIRYSLLAPGKRIRPRLLFASARLFGLPESVTGPAAAAVEMTHCFTLIHDDLPCMDDDDFRRGRPSNHRVFGEAVALLAGDALLSLSVEALLEAQAAAGAAGTLRAAKRLMSMIGPAGVMGGQSAELLLTEKSKLDEIMKVHAGKTGALFEAALLMPRDLAGAPEEGGPAQALDRFARALGLAFQIADDLEDPAEDPDPTHVLRYLSPEQARDLASQGLIASLEALQESWRSAPTTELAAIASEVLRKIAVTGSAGGR